MIGVLRGIGAALAGFIAMVAIVLAFELLLVALLPDAFREPDGSWRLPDPLLPWYLANLAYSTVAAIGGGWITVRLAGRARRTALAVLLGVVLIGNVVTLLGPGAAEGIAVPAWWTVGELAAALVGIPVGAKLAARRRFPDRTRQPDGHVPRHHERTPHQ